MLVVSVAVVVVVVVTVKVVIVAVVVGSGIGAWLVLRQPVKPIPKGPRTPKMRF